MNRWLRAQLRRTLAAFTSAALACHLFIPVGYMPAAVGTGSPVMLCKSVLPAGALSDQGSNHRHDNTQTKYCPLGALAGMALATGTIASSTPYLKTGQATVPAIRSAIQAVRTPSRSRDPPLTSFNVTLQT